MVEKSSYGNRCLQHDGAPCLFDACCEKSFGPPHFVIAGLVSCVCVCVCGGGGIAWPPRYLDFAHFDAFLWGHLKNPISKTLWKQDDLLAS